MISPTLPCERGSFLVSRRGRVCAGAPSSPPRSSWRPSRSSPSLRRSSLAPRRAGHTPAPTRFKERV